MQIAGIVEVSIVVWSRYITLKPFWRTLKCSVIKGCLFHILHEAFYKNFYNFGVFKLALSICTKFLARFLLNEELYKKFVAVLKVCQRLRHQKNTKSVKRLLKNSIPQSQEPVKRRIKPIEVKYGDTPVF